MDIQELSQHLKLEPNGRIYPVTGKGELFLDEHPELLSKKNTQRRFEYLELVIKRVGDILLDIAQTSTSLKNLPEHEAVKKWKRKAQSYSEVSLNFNFFSFQDPLSLLIQSTLSGGLLFHKIKTNFKYLILEHGGFEAAERKIIESLYSNSYKNEDDK